MRVPSRRFAKPLEYFRLKRATQISESHCGPAVVQMLLSNLSVPVSQEQVAEAGNAIERLELHGMRVDQLALAVCRLVPDAAFWYKHRASLEDVIALVSEHLYPVGVEWQGIFDDEDDEDEDDAGEGDEDGKDDDEDDEDDFGHYSVITHVDQEKQELIIVDPYKTFVEQDHILGFDEFVERWWDTNEVINAKTGRPRYVKDIRLLFIITPKDVTFPKELGLKRARCDQDQVLQRE